MLQYDFKLRRYLVPLFISIFILWAVFVRFYNITLQGIQGDDVFWYFEMAKKWALGNPVISFHYRPVTHLTYSVGMHLFGINDFSIKITNSILNLTAGILIYFCSLITTKDKLISLLSSIVYLSLPFVISESRSELSHILSTFYLLLSYLFFALYFQMRKQKNFKKDLALSLSGIFLGMTAHIHPDLATLGLPFSIFIAVSLFYQLRSQQCFEANYQAHFIKEFLIFSLSYFSIFMIFFAAFGPFHVVKNVLQGFGHQNNNLLIRSQFESFTRYFTGLAAYLKASLGNGGALLFFSSLIIALFLKCKKRKEELITYLPMSLVIFHLVTCIFIVQRKFILRLAHPSIPFMLITTLFWTSSLMKYYQIKGQRWVLCGLSIFILFSCNFSFFNKENYQTSIYRQVYNLLEKKITPSSKILITPSLFHWYRKGFHLSAYFNKNAVYLSEYMHGVWKFDRNILTNFKKLINLRQIQYILIARNDKNIRKTLISHHDAKMFIKSMYGIDRNKYTLAWEYQQLIKLVKDLNAKKIYSNKKFDIYKIPRPLK